MKDDAKVCIAILIWGILSSLNIFLGVLFMVFAVVLGLAFNYQTVEAGDRIVIYPRFINEGSKVMLLVDNETSSKLRNRIPFVQEWEKNEKKFKYTLVPYTRRRQTQDVVKIFCKVL